jgi:hypothetical protein
VEVEEYEWVSSSFFNLVHFVQVPRIRSSFDITDTSRDVNMWIKICARI